MIKRLRAGWKRALGYLKRNGISAAAWAVAERLLLESRQRDYRYEPPPGEELLKQRREAEGWENPPFFSVVVPAYETPPEFLRVLLDSMLQQSWRSWELVIADAGSTDSVERVVKGYRDTRIRYVKLSENLGIAGNTNAALKEVRGDYTGLLDHDDFLAPDALYEMACALRRSGEKGISPVLLYSDEDKCDGTGQHFYEPNRKTDFNLDLLLSNNYICHFLMLRTDFFQELKERPGFDGAQDYDLVLRAAAGVLAGVPEEAYVHVPKVLYHWRCHETSTASNPESKRYAYEAGKRALEDFCAAQGWSAQVEDTRHLGFYRIRYLPDVLTVRKDVAAVACPLSPRRGRLCSGIYDRDVNGGGTLMRFSGLPRRFSGYMHRAVLQQDVETADVRALRVRDCAEAEGGWREGSGNVAGNEVEYDAEDGAGYAAEDGVRLSEKLQQAQEAVRRGEDPVQVSLAFCRSVREAGGRILWDPQEMQESQEMRGTQETR